MVPKGPLPPLSPRRAGFELPDLSEARLPIIAQGSTWVLVSKPSGLLSVPAKDPQYKDCALTRVQSWYPQATGGMVVHRLDLPTSGLLLFALTPESLANLNRQFAKRTVSKSYTAILEKIPLVSEGDIHLPLRLDPFQRPLQVVDPLHGKSCHTRWRILDAQYILGCKVELIPITGRTHQLRVHSAHALGLNSPILGDPHYSANAQANGSSPQDLRLHLHASSLSFDDPETGERLHFIDDAPF